MESLWPIITIVGPILFGLVLAWSIWRNRRETRRGDVERSDRAAKALREQLDREDKQREQSSTGS